MKIDERKNSLRVGSVASAQGTVSPVTKGAHSSWSLTQVHTCETIVLCLARYLISLDKGHILHFPRTASYLID